MKASDGKIGSAAYVGGSGRVMRVCTSFALVITMGLGALTGCSAPQSTSTSAAASVAASSTVQPADWPSSLFDIEGFMAMDPTQMGAFVQSQGLDDSWHNGDKANIPSTYSSVDDTIWQMYVSAYDEKGDAIDTSSITSDTRLGGVSVDYSIGYVDTSNYRGIMSDTLDAYTKAVGLVADIFTGVGDGSAAAAGHCTVNGEDCITVITVDPNFFDVNVTCMNLELWCQQKGITTDDAAIEDYFNGFYEPSAVIQNVTTPQQQPDISYSPAYSSEDGAVTYGNLDVTVSHNDFYDQDVVDVTGTFTNNTQSVLTFQAVVSFYDAAGSELYRETDTELNVGGGQSGSFDVSMSGDNAKDVTKVAISSIEHSSL